jgi:hypothetical protein
VIVESRKSEDLPLDIQMEAHIAADLTLIAYRKLLTQMPSFEELRAPYGDPNGRKVYMLPRDLEQKWMDMHEHETGVHIPLD